MQLNNKKKGFTLIEILIVVAIIGILASIVLVGLGPAQRQGRDARRISDLKQVQVGLELYFHKCGYYPGTAQVIQPCEDFAPIAAGITRAVWEAGIVATLTGSNIGVPAIPNDPVTTKTYFYGVSTDGTSYVLGAGLEGSNTALDNDVDGTDVFGVNCNIAGAGTIENVYCVQL